jgi:hypothetical protein
MRALISTMLVCLILLTLLSNGCMTQSSIKYAKGRPDEAWTNNKFNSRFPEPADPNVKPEPSYYALLPLTVPADIVTSPFQLIGAGYYHLFNAEGL